VEVLFMAEAAAVGFFWGASWHCDGLRMKAPLEEMKVTHEGGS
jgi:hypothetical protein